MSDRLEEAMYRLRELGEWDLAFAVNVERKELVRLREDYEVVNQYADKMSNNNARLREEKAGLWRDREAFVKREARLREELRFAESADDERDAELARLRESERRYAETALNQQVELDRLREALKHLIEAKEVDELLIQGEWGIPGDPGYGEPSSVLTAARNALKDANG